jgi:hypothetical protein
MRKVSAESEAITAKVQEVADGIGFDGKTWRVLVDALNEHGTKTPQGGEWTNKYLPVFCKRKDIVFTPKLDVAEPQKPAPETSHTEPEQAPIDAFETASDQSLTAIIPEPEPAESGPTEAETSHTTATPSTNEAGQTWAESSYTSPDYNGVTPSMPSSMTVEQQQEKVVSEPLPRSSYPFPTDEHTEQHIDQPVLEPGHTHGAPMSHTEIAELVTATVKRELTQLLKGAAPMPVQMSGRHGGVMTVKKTVSVPADVWGQVESTGLIASNVVTAALRLYFNLKQAEGGEQ